MIPRHPDPLSSEARRLIDAAVADGRVRRIPAGVSGLRDPMHAAHADDDADRARELMGDKTPLTQAGGLYR